MENIPSLGSQQMLAPSPSALYAVNALLLNKIHQREPPFKMICLLQSTKYIPTLYGNFQGLLLLLLRVWVFISACRLKMKLRTCLFKPLLAGSPLRFLPRHMLCYQLSEHVFFTDSLNLARSADAPSAAYSSVLWEIRQQVMKFQQLATPL